METFTATTSEWQAILDAMPSLVHPAIRKPVIDRLASLLALHGAGPDDPVTLQLDDAGAVAVHRARHYLSRDSGRSDEANAAIAEAEIIIRDHQRRR